MNKPVILSSIVEHCNNVGVVDRVLRLILGLACLAYLYISHYLFSVSNLSLVLCLASIYPVLTAWTAWDPIYELFGVSTKRIDTKETEVENNNTQSILKTINNDQQESLINKSAA